jgi:23S rRNA G2445 N2-methylase RlmL
LTLYVRRNQGRILLKLNRQ